MLVFRKWIPEPDPERSPTPLQTRSSIRSQPSLGDLFVFLLLLFLALSLFLLPLWLPLWSGHAGQSCTITWDSGETTLPLDTAVTYTVESRGHTLVVAIEDGFVRVAETTCPDALCQSAGAIDGAGEMLVCVPAGVVIRIPQAANGNEEDFIVG